MASLSRGQAECFLLVAPLKIRDALVDRSVAVECLVWPYFRCRLVRVASLVVVAFLRCAAADSVFRRRIRIRASCDCVCAALGISFRCFITSVVGASTNECVFMGVRYEWNCVRVCVCVCVCLGWSSICLLNSRDL